MHQWLTSPPAQNLCVCMVFVTPDTVILLCFTFCVFLSFLSFFFFFFIAKVSIMHYTIKCAEHAGCVHVFTDVGFLLTSSSKSVSNPPPAQTIFRKLPFHCFVFYKHPLITLVKAYRNQSSYTTHSKLLKNKETAQ